MKLMENHKLLALFKLEMVETIAQTKGLEELVKLQIDIVPKLVIFLNEGNNKKMIYYEGPKAFEWVKDYLVSSRRQIMMQTAETSRKLIQSDNTKIEMKDGLFGYCPDEHNGISDQYTLCREDVNIALPKVFVPYTKQGQTEEEKIMTVPIGKIGDYKKKEGIGAIYGKDIKNIVSQIENTRLAQDKQIKSIIEQATISTVMKYENR
jgi:hypothetical protein